jgi:hypothetical protein
LLTKIAVAPITDSHAATAVASALAADQHGVITFEATPTEESVKFVPAVTGQPEIVSLSSSGQGQSQSTAAAAAVTTKAQPDAAISSDQMIGQVNPAAVAVSGSQHSAAPSDSIAATSSITIAETVTEQVSLQQIVDNAAVGHHPAYDARVEAALVAFWGANPHAQAVYDQQNMIVYDGPTPLAAATVQVWELGHGAVIAVVGHADSPTAHL